MQAGVTCIKPNDLLSCFVQPSGTPHGMSGLTANISKLDSCNIIAFTIILSVTPYRLVALIIYESNWSYIGSPTDILVVVIAESYDVTEFEIGMGSDLNVDK